MSARQKFMGVVKGLILSYLLTIIMLFITAVVVYKVGISDKVLGILVVVIYIVATFAGGFVTGRKVRENFYFIYLCVIIPIYDIKREVYPE